MSKPQYTALHRAAKAVMVTGTLAAAGFGTPWAKAAPASDTLPNGERVTAGEAKMVRDGRTMTISQSTDRLITHWQDFSIGAEARVEFVQPSSSSAALNRVTGGKPSEIFGSLSANG